MDPDASSARDDARTYDVVVIGAGPAGSATALRSAARGLDTLLVDRATFPRDKVCGSCLHPRAFDELADLDPSLTPTALGGVPLTTARIGARGRWADLPLGGACVLSRHRLDARLVDAAVDRGAALRTATVARLGASEARGAARRVELTPVDGGEASLVGASVVVAADGLGGPLLARTGEVSAPPSSDARVGLGAVVDGDLGLDLPAGRVVLAVATEGYLGLARLEDGRVDLAAAVDPRALARSSPDALCARVARASGLDIDPAILDTEWRGTPPLTRSPSTPYGPRALAVGDAAGYVEPFTGEGIAWALASARVAAEHLPRLVEDWSAARAAEWAARSAAELRERRRRCAAVAKFVRHPGWVAAAAPLLAHSGVLAALVARVGYGRAR